MFEQQGSSRALSRRVLEQQRPRYQAARTALGPRTRLQEAVNPAALAFTPGKRLYTCNRTCAALLCLFVCMIALLFLHSGLAMTHAWQTNSYVTLRN